MPLTVAYQQGTLSGGPAPTLLHVYGAYGYTLEADFEPHRRLLMDRGWVVALAHVRGGGELGRRWHAMARQLTKACSVRDTLACAQALVSSGEVQDAA